MLADLPSFQCLVEFVALTDALHSRSLHCLQHHLAFDEEVSPWHILRCVECGFGPLAVPHGLLGGAEDMTSTDALLPVYV